MVVLQLSAIYRIVLFFLALSFHLSIFSKLWWCLWPVNAPSVMLGFSGSAWLGSGPLRGPLTPGSEGFQTWFWLMRDSLFFFFFLSREKHVSLYHPISGEGCEVTLEDSADAICSSRLSPGEVLQTHWDLFIFHLKKKKKKEFACYLFRKMNAEIMFHSAPFQNTSWNHKSWPRWGENAE